MLQVVTRIGDVPWRLPFGGWLGESTKPDDVAFGPDGRYLFRNGLDLLCLSPAGRKLWSYRLPSIPSCATALDGSGDFLFGLRDGRIVAITPYGERAKDFAASRRGAITAVGAYGDGGIAGYSDGRLALLGTGASIAVNVMEKMPASPEAFAGVPGRLAIVDAHGGLALYDGNGKRRWLVDSGMTGSNAFLASDRIILTGLGRAASFSLDGTLLRAATITNAAAPALLAPSGLLFSAGDDWILGAYRFEGPLTIVSPPAPPACPADPNAIDTLGFGDMEGADEERQLSIIADIEKSLDSATIGRWEAGDRAVLEKIASGTASVLDEGAARRRFHLFSRPRIEACRTLGEIGSPASIGTLAEVALSGGDPAVRASALEAIGAIGLDPDAGAETALAMAGAGMRLDDEVAFALVDAIESLVFGSGLPPSAGALRSLFALAGPTYPNAVGTRARAALARFARGHVVD